MAKKKTAKKAGKGGAKKTKNARTGVDEAFIASRVSRLPLDAGETLPAIPVAQALLEAERVHAEGKKIRAGLVRLPDFDADDLDKLPVVMAALAARERRWQSARIGVRAASLKDARDEAEELRGTVIAAGRYLLRNDAKAQAELDVIAEGDGLADLIADLDNLAAFLDAHRGVLAEDPHHTGDAAGKLRKLAATLRGGVETGEAQDAQAERNRVAAVLAQAVREVRMGARYLLWDKPKRLAAFTSAYTAQKNRRRKKSVPAVSGATGTSGTPVSPT